MPNVNHHVETLMKPWRTIDRRCSIIKHWGDILTSHCDTWKMLLAKVSWVEKESDLSAGRPVEGTFVKPWRKSKHIRTYIICIINKWNAQSTFSKLFFFNQNKSPLAEMWRHFFNTSITWCQHSNTSQCIRLWWPPLNMSHVNRLQWRLIRFDRPRMGHIQMIHSQAHAGKVQPQIQTKIISVLYR